MVLEDDVALGSERVPHSLEPCLYELHVVLGEVGGLLELSVGRAILAKGREVDLHGVEALFHSDARCLGVVFGARVVPVAFAPAHLELACIGPKRVMQLAAEKHPDRHA